MIHQNIQMFSKQTVCCEYRDRLEGENKTRCHEKNNTFLLDTGILTFVGFQQITCRGLGNWGDGLTRM